MSVFSQLLMFDRYKRIPWTYEQCLSFRASIASKFEIRDTCTFDILFFSFITCAYTCSICTRSNSWISTYYQEIILHLSMCVYIICLTFCSFFPFKYNSMMTLDILGVIFFFFCSSNQIDWCFVCVCVCVFLLVGRKLLLVLLLLLMLFFFL